MRIASLAALLIMLALIAVIPAKAQATPSPAQSEIDAWEEKLEEFREWRADKNFQIPHPRNESQKPYSPSEKSRQLRKKLGDWLVVNRSRPESEIEHACIAGYRFDLSGTQITAGGAEQRFEQVRTFLQKTGQYPKSPAELLALLHPKVDTLPKEAVFTLAATYVPLDRDEPIDFLYPENENAKEPKLCDSYIRKLSREQTQITLEMLPAPPGTDKGGQVVSFWYDRVHGEGDRVLEAGLSTFVRKELEQSPKPGTSI